MAAVVALSSFGRPGETPGGFGLPCLPVAAVTVFAGFLLLSLAVAGRTLGYDFLAYHAAAARLIHGQPLYDTGFEAIGGFGLFYYPPTALPLILPFGALNPTLPRACGSCSWSLRSPSAWR